MELEALVLQILPVAKGVSQRGEWIKQEVIFEQVGEFGRKICVGFWGDKAQDAAELKPGEKVKISANVESREYNGRWYTEVRAWKLAKTGVPVPGADPAPHGHDFPPVSTDSSYESAESSSKEEFDDLPF